MPDHIDRIRIMRHLPATLVSRWSGNADRKVIWNEWLPGSLMHCDVTGFTAMNESLSKMGREGAEVMARILNQFFETMLGIARERGGIQMKFGGDAMLLYFPDAGHAHRAARCGLDMQAAMKPFSKLAFGNEEYCLRMRIGIHSGSFYSASIGQDNGLLHYFLSGDDVNYAADVEPKANPDQVVVSDQTADLIRNEARLRPTEHDGIWEVREVTAAQVNLKVHDITLLPFDVLQRYLMPPLIEDSAAITNEHRRVTVIFIYLQGFSRLLRERGDDEALRQVNDYMNLVFDLANRHGGYLSASDASEHGDKLIVLFGAPKSLGNHETSALLFAHELNEKLKDSDLTLKHQIGVNSGFVFAGEIGSSWRREYTTIGDNVNLSARLMAAAGVGNILISASTAEKLPAHFQLAALEPIMVKGKSKPISIFRFEGIGQAALATTIEDDIRLLGRDEELAQLEAKAELTATGKFSWCYMHGEPGIGKSRLVNELVSMLSARQWLTMIGICQAYNLHNPFSAWIYPLRKLLGIHGVHDPEGLQKIETYFLNNLPDQQVFVPLIADILSIPCPDSALMASLDPKTRRDKRISVMSELIRFASSQTPVCIFLDNVQWADSSSLEVLGRLAELRHSAVMLVMASRNNEPPPAMAEKLEGSIMKLDRLSDAASREFLEIQIDLTEEQYQRLLERAKGNPLFLKELSQSTQFAEGEVPESVYDLIVSRLDHLDAFKKMLLKNAAVIGQIFDQNTLYDLEKLQN